uniref:Uncharacterized protein n=1 Tax=Aegilops tauschii subsp. strangulata TaxID=200361 RepID=A0A453IT51_AEGTS
PLSVATTSSKLARCERSSIIYLPVSGTPSSRNMATGMRFLQLFTAVLAFCFAPANSNWIPA